MALDQQTLQVLQEISASIRAIHVLMQQSNARQQGPSGPSDPQGPEPAGSRRPGPAEWFGQNISGITSNLSYRQHYPSPYSYPGMAGHMSHMGMGMMGMGMGMGMGPFTHGHVPSQQKDDKDDKKELVDIIGKLIDTLKNFSDDFEKAGFGTGSGKSGRKPKPMVFGSLRDKWEYEHGQEVIFKGAKDRLEEAKQKYFKEKEWKGKSTMGKVGTVIGAAIEGGARVGMSLGNAMHAMYRTEGKDPDIGQGAQSLSRSLMGAGGKLGAFGNALSIVTMSLQAMKGFADSAHRMNMRLAEWSPSMARVAVYSEVEQIMSDQRKGEARAESAMRLARARAQMTRDNEEIQNDIANLGNTIAEGAAKTVGFVGGLYGDIKFRAGFMSPEQQASYLEKLAKDDPEIAKMLGTHGKEFSEGVKDIMNAKWIESYGAAAHWKNWTDD